ncbi:replication-relaxation family protein [Nocardia sp. NPDC059229]
MVSPHSHRSGFSFSDALAAQRLLTPRDLRLVGLLAEHRVLTAHQIARLLFGCDDTAQRRLKLLATRGVLARFRCCIRPGSQEYRYTLGPLGAMIHAADHGLPLPTARTSSEKAFKLSRHPQLDHLLGINEFFTTLAHHARTHPGSELVVWRNEYAAADMCGRMAHPDGYGHWTENGRSVRFFLEYDTGTEQLSRLVDKLHGYRDVATAGLNLPILFVFPGAARRDNFLRTLTGHPTSTSTLTIAATPLPDLDAAGPTVPIWQTPASTIRCRLIDLPVPPAAHTSAA